MSTHTLVHSTSALVLRTEHTGFTVSSLDDAVNLWANDAVKSEGMNFGLDVGEGSIRQRLDRQARAVKC